MEMETGGGWIGVAGVADLCQVLNNETSAYSKLFILCRLYCCCGDSYFFFTEGVLEQTQ